MGIRPSEPITKLRETTMKHHHAFTTPTGVLLLFLLWTANLTALTPGEQADSFYARGQAAEDQGALQAAEQCYQLALRVNSGHPAALAGLKGLAVKLQDPFQTTVFDRFQCSDASLQEVLDYLRGKFHKATQGKHMPDFVWKFTPGSRLITLDLRNGTAAKVLEAVCQQAGLRYQRDGDRVVLYDAGTPPPPLTKSAPSPSAPSPAPMASSGLLDWTNTSGKTLKAAFVRLDGGEAVLKTAEGKEFRYPISSLNPAGQAQARSMGKPNGGKPPASPK